MEGRSRGQAGSRVTRRTFQATLSIGTLLCFREGSCRAGAGAVCGRPVWWVWGEAGSGNRLETQSRRKVVSLQHRSGEVGETGMDLGDLDLDD